MLPVLVIRRSTSASLLLLAILAGCNGKDTAVPDVWPRVIEPRLSATTVWQPCRQILRPGHVVAEAQCQPPRTIAACDETAMDARKARRAIALRSPCLERAIGFLQRTSRRDARAMNDLAAAYYVRAQLDDRASDLLRALDTAEQAVAIRPSPPGAHFNLALILESLGLDEDAIAEWERAANSDSGDWAREARAHREKLIKAAAASGDRRWEAAKERIASALQKNDEEGIAAAVAPFPMTAEQYFEDIVLPEWPEKRSVATLRVFANALSRTAGDHLGIDTVFAIERASPHQLAALKQGHVLLSSSHSQDRRLKPDAAARVYREAARLLKAGGSPLALTAEIGLATLDENLVALQEVQKTATGRGYVRLAARARANAAYALFRRNRYVESLAEYDEALRIYVRLDDAEGIASTQARRIGILRVLGQYEQAWRAGLPTVRKAASIVDLKAHHLLIGETAAIATKFECPHTALAYMNAEVRHFQEEESTLPDPERAQVVEANVAIARRNRAAVELQLDQLNAAQEDIDKASHLVQRDTDKTARRLLEARLDEIKGESLLRTDPNGAATMLQRAADLSGDEYNTFQVALAVERADALRRAGRRDDAEAAMRDAVDRLHREETSTLEQRNQGIEPIWKEYFERFREANDLLIRQLVEDHRGAEAFAYNEEAHAFEPLDLILRRADTPRAFRDLAAAPPAALLSRLRTFLPPGTFVIEYRVLDDLTYAWVVSRDRARVLRLAAKRSDVERWTTTLQDAAAAGDRDAFAAALYAPYDKLIGPAVAVAGNSASRLVLVPDEFMHGLPFAALRDPNSQRYLIQRAPISISGSAALYVFSLLRDAALPSSKVAALLVGDPAFDERFAPETRRLPAARDEVRQIAMIYDGNAEELTDRDATPSRFLRDAAQKQIIHIAAHAVTAGDTPKQSYLLMARDRSGTGLLDAQTLLNSLHLETTRLVVLGACRSGGSVTVGPQGVAPLVRPFLAAGVPGVIGTLWDINDATARQVLVSFHRHYRDGSDAAAALRAAQIELLQDTNPGLSSELTWGAYQAIGFASSPFPSAGEMKKEKPP